MPTRKFLWLASVPLCLLAFLLQLAAQVPPATPDPLARMQAGSAGCLAEGNSLCAEATPKIISNALGPSPLADNLRRLTDEIGGRVMGSPAPRFRSG